MYQYWLLNINENNIESYSKIKKIDRIKTIYILNFFSSIKKVDHDHVRKYSK